MAIKSQDGSAFSLVSIDFHDAWWMGEDFIIEGFRSGVSTGLGIQFAGTSDGSYVNLSQSDELTPANFQNIDEARIYGINGNYGPSVNNIQISDPVVPNNIPSLGGTPADDTATEDVATAIDLSDYNISDADGDTITLTLTVDRGTIASTDGDGTTAGVTITDSGTDNLTLQGSSANLNTYLNDTSKIQYTTSPNDTVSATLTVIPFDGTVDGVADTINISITAVNDAPILDNASTPTLTAVDEDPSSNAGTLISALLGAALTDVDSGASEGIAVTAVDNTNGTWQYSTDGTNWSGVGTVSDSSALLLAADDKLRFVPNADYNGSANITYRGWDQTSGTAGNKVDASTSGGTTAFSTATESASVTINAVDDAPTGSGAATPASFTEDTQSNLDLSGFTVADADSASVTITLTASAGTLAASSSGSVTVGGTGSAMTLTLTGAPDDINTYLDTTSNVQYTGASDANGTGAATITITGADVTTSNVAMGSVSLNISAVDDAPTVSGVPDESVVLSVGQRIDLAASSVADVDSTSVTAVISVDSGALTAASAASNHSGGAAVVQTNSQTVTLTGSPAQVDAYLNDTNELSFTSAASTTDVTLTVSVDDGVNSTVSDTATISVLDVARPTASNYTDSTNEDTAVTAFSNTELPTAEDADTGTAHTVEYITIDTSTVSGGVLSLTASATGGTSTVGGITFDTAEGDLSGTVNIAIGDIDHLVFTPTAELSGNGAGSFDWTVTDSNGDTSDQATWTLNIPPVEDAPTLTGVTASITALEDTATHLVTGTPIFADVDTTGDIVATLTATDASAVLTASDADGVVVGNSGSNSITLTGTADEINTFLATSANISYTGSTDNTTTDTVTVSVNDGEGGTDASAATITVNFTPVNDAPLIVDLDGDSVAASLTGSEYIDEQPLDAEVAGVTDVDSDDLDGGYLKITQTSGTSDGSFTSDHVTDGELTFGAVEASADGTPAAGDIVWVNGVNIGTVDSTHTGQNGADFQVNFNTGSTPDSDTGSAGYLLSYLKYGATTEGVRTFSVTVNDGDGGTSAAASFTVTVIDDTKPVATSYTDTTNEDTAVTLSATELATTVDADPNTNHSLEYITIDTSTVVGGVLSLDSTGTSGTSSVGDVSYYTTQGDLTGTVHINIADIGKLIFTPTANLAGTGAAGFNWTVTDSGGDTSPTATYTLDITGVADAPEGTDKTISLQSSATHTFSASDFGFTDVDSGDALHRVQINVQSLDNGVLQLSGTDVSDSDWITLADISNLVYTPNATGEDSFTFTVEDNSTTPQADSSPNTLTLNVTNPPSSGGTGTPPVESEPELPDQDDWANLDDNDGDGVPEDVEDFVPSVDGLTTGDGNGDGIDDREQADVSSVPFRDTDKITVDQDAPVVFVTLAALPQTNPPGETETNTTKIRDVEQWDAPEDKPDALITPMGMISFKADVASDGAIQNFSLLVDDSVTVNGYWKQTSGGSWVNLASSAYGGSVEKVGNKWQVNFVIQEGGVFDDDGVADGVISDPGALGFMEGYTGDTPFAGTQANQFFDWILLG